jgi:4-amino-4-deoxy-L-arabinose transferase-like glycosyltransferase
MRQWWRASSFTVKLVIIAIGALIWRIVYIKLELGFQTLTDEAWYVGQAHNLFGAHPWTSIFDYNIPTAQHGPLTSIVMAPVAWLFPHATVSMRFVMAVIGSVTVFVCGLAAREIGGERAGLFGGVIAAVMPDLWIRDGLVVSEPLAALLVVSSIWLIVRSKRQLSYRILAALGALCGLMALTRAEETPARVVIVLVACLKFTNMTQWRLWAPRVAVALMVGAGIVAPWSWYNSSRFADSVLISNNIGTTLVGANCPDTYFGSALIGYDSLNCEFAAQRAAAKISTDESVQSSILRRQAEHFVRQHLSRIPQVVVMRELWFLGAYRPGWVVHIGTLGGQPAWATWLQAVSFYGLLPLALWSWWRVRRRKLPHWLLGILTINSFVVVAVFVGHWRYRVTLDIAMILLLSLGFQKNKVSEFAAPTFSDAPRDMQSAEIDGLKN